MPANDENAAAAAVPVPDHADHAGLPAPGSFFPKPDSESEASPVDLARDDATLGVVTQNAHAPFAGHRVLVADDEPVNRQIARRMLEQLGCIAAVASNGREAVDMHRTSAYELILMDCHMPELDGYQATRRIRALPGAASRTPVIALTASTGLAEQENCSASGMDGFISKPVRLPGLRALLERWLRVDVGSPPASSAACNDELEAIRQMFGRDFPDLAATYQSDSPPRIALLHQARASGDSARVAKIAHALGGSSASIGAMRLCALCRELELQARQESLNDFARQMAAIETEYDRVSGTLRSMVASED